MFIKELNIKNFRLFEEFSVEGFNVPDDENEGSGLTILVGENGCGKTTILDALALPYVSYKADSFSLDDMNNPEEKTDIKLIAVNEFEFKGTMPKTTYKGKGFLFTGGKRARSNSKYLSSITVSDQLYLRSDSEDKPKDGSPDLRLSVNNPFSGNRFTDNDFLILDKNRTYQTKKGTYNDTRFDRLMEDLSYQHIQNDSMPVDLNEIIKSGGGVQNDSLAATVTKFSMLSNLKVRLKMIDNWKPYSNSFFGVQKENLQIIPLNQLGSGYEMIFSLIYAFNLSQQSEKDLIVLIDEPELHLHPKLQLDFVKLLLEYSKTAQIIITTHSPLLVKQALHNDFVKVKTLVKEDNVIIINSQKEMLLPYLSSNEINFVSFGLATEEYHNEIYENLMQLKSSNSKIKEFDISYFQNLKGEPKNSPWMGYENEVSIHTFIRNQIHHRADNGAVKYDELYESIKKLRTFLKEERKDIQN